MFRKIFGKHAAEFARAIRNRHVEVGDHGGLYFAKQRASLFGNFEIQRNGGPFEVMDNLVVLEGRNYLLMAGIRGSVAGIGTWYIVPFVNNTAIADNLTAATFNSSQAEFTNYSETNRQAWVTVDPTATSVLTNAASVATITIGSGGQTAVYGAGILSGQAKGSSTAPLLAAALATTPKTGLELGETLGFRYALTLASS